MKSAAMKEGAMQSTMTFLGALTLCTAAGAGGWSYEVSRDKMTGKQTTYARVDSDNRLEFKFPYQAADNRGRVTVRQHPQHGLDVILAIDKGQIICSSLKCPIQVKFDDAQPVHFDGSPPESGDSTVVFLGNASGFVARARKARKILVQFTAYQAGSPILEFSAPVPLGWPHKPGK